MEYLDTIIGAVIAWSAYRVGISREAARAKSRKPEEKKPICGCGHHRSFHKDGGKCNKDKFEGTCRCQKYIGPITYDEFVAEP